MTWRERLFREDVSSNADVTRRGCVEHRIEIYYARTAHEYKSGALAHDCKFFTREETLIFRRDACHHEYDLRLAQHRIERCRLTSERFDIGRRQPGVERPHHAAKRRYKRQDRAPQVAHADEPNRRAIQRERVPVCIESILLGAAPKTPVRMTDPASKIDRHAQRRLGHGFSEYRAHVKDANALPETLCVVHVRKKIP